MRLRSARGRLCWAGRRCRFRYRRGRVVVSDSHGNALFTGYVATEPGSGVHGDGTTGTVYRYAINAVSDEWLLDKLAVPTSGAGLGASVGQVLRTLTQRVGSGLVSTAGVTGGRAIGVFQPVSTEAWSVNAGALAGAAYGAYRVVNGALSLSSAGSVTHTLSDGDGVFAPGALAAGSVKELANDVTVTGETEPTAYVTEMFAGDGTTAVFTLGEPPLKTAASKAKLVFDEFDEGVFNPAVWVLSDPGSTGAGDQWAGDVGRERLRWADDADGDRCGRDRWVVADRGGVGTAGGCERWGVVWAVFGGDDPGELPGGV